MSAILSIPAEICRKYREF